MTRFVIALASMGAAVAQPVRTGQLLIATNLSPDPAFARAVILIVQADKEGIAGLMLNRPTDVDILRVLPELRQAANQTVYAGGPLALGINALIRSRAQPPEAGRVTGGIWLITNPSAIAHEVAAHPASARVYIGQSGWSIKQMDSELARGLWIVTLAPAAVVFDPKPETLWARLHQRLAR